MMVRNAAVFLILLAMQLTRIAVAARRKLRGPAVRLSLAPLAGGAAEASLECAGKRFARTETYRQCDFQDWHPGLADQPQRRHFQPAPAQVVAKGFAHPCREQAVKVKRGKMGDFGQRAQFKRLVDVAVDMLDHFVHAPGIGSLVFLRCHG